MIFKKKEKKSKVYRCDPNKNIHCKKDNCYIFYPMCCRHTLEKQYRMTNLWRRIKEDYRIWKYHRKLGLRPRNSKK